MRVYVMPHLDAVKSGSTYWVMLSLPVENVQDYPRPPRLDPVAQRLAIVMGGTVVAETMQGWRVCETHHAPSYYLPAGCFAPGFLQPASGQSFCEWKGRAGYFDLHWNGAIKRRAAWTYPAPTPGFAAIAGHIAIYAWAVDAAFVGVEQVRPQPGDFYGGWVTANLRGVIKGGAGTEGW